MVICICGNFAYRHLVRGVFFRINIKRLCTQESQSRRWEYQEGKGQASGKCINHINRGGREEES